MSEKVMDHVAYEKKVKKMSTEALLFVIEDCREAVRLQSGFNDNCGYYQDELFHCQAELKKRVEPFKPSRTSTVSNHFYMQTIRELRVIAEELRNVSSKHTTSIGDISRIADRLLKKCEAVL